MKSLRVIRILLAISLFLASSACLIFGPQVNSLARAAQQSQIILSAASVTMGATLVWLSITFLFGRVYCAFACPIGTLSDFFARIRPLFPKINKSFSYRHPASYSYHILGLYVLCLILGIVAVPYFIEPWNIAQNIAAIANPKSVSLTWATIGLGAATGIAAGILALLFIAVTSIVYSRDFCSRICPIGSALGLIQERAVWHLEINPDKCIDCRKCEEVCRSQCIKSISRYVDEARCVRCLDCVTKCPNSAIKFQINRNKRATPLFRKVKS